MNRTIVILNSLQQYEHWWYLPFDPAAMSPERASLVRMAFELYATGTYTFRALLQALNDAGLRTRPTAGRGAGKPLSMHKLGDILRDRYYLGYVTYKDQEYPGRHEPLVSVELFDQVQEMLTARGGTGTRERIHHHYLKGTVWCHSPRSSTDNYPT